MARDATASESDRFPALSPESAGTSASPVDARARVQTGVLRHAIAAALMAALPVWRAIDLTQSVDAGLTLTAVFGGAAWFLWQDCSGAEVSWRRSFAAAALLAACSWQLAWIDAADFWFFRVTLVAWAIAWVLLTPRAQGWRVIAGFGLWAICFDAHLLAHFSVINIAAAKITAAVAGWLLWQFGASISGSGSLLTIGTSTVEVGTACTGLPLAVILLALVGLSGLFLRLRLLEIARLAVTTMVAAFFIGVARVCVLTLLADDAAAFAYWHGPGGNAWFSTAGIAFLAWLLSRRRAATNVSATKPHAGLLPRHAVVAAAVPIAFALAVPFAVGRAGPSTATFPAVGGWTLTQQSAETFDVTPARRQDRFGSLRQASYSHANGGRLVVSRAELPVMLTPDARSLPDAIHRFGVNASWVPTPGVGLVKDDAAHLRVVVIVDAQGQPAGGQEDWIARSRRGTTDLARWLGWFQHRHPLRDTAAACIHVEWTGPASERPQAPAAIAAAVAAWSASHAFPFRSS